MSLWGYARISTAEQSTDLQRDALLDAGVPKGRIRTEVASGVKTARPVLDELLTKLLQPGDTLVVWRLDRLGRNLAHLIAVVEDLDERDIAFRSLTEQLDTTTPAGRLIFNIFGSLAEFERALIVERTKAGLAAARARGRHGGRKSYVSAAKLAHVKELRALTGDQQKTMAQISTIVGVPKSTLYHALKRDAQQTAKEGLRR